MDIVDKFLEHASKLHFHIQIEDEKNVRFEIFLNVKKEQKEQYF